MSKIWVRLPSNYDEFIKGQIALLDLIYANPNSEQNKSARRLQRKYRCALRYQRNAGRGKRPRKHGQRRGG